MEDVRILKRLFYGVLRESYRNELKVYMNKFEIDNHQKDRNRTAWRSICGTEAKWTRVNFGKGLKEKGKRRKNPNGTEDTG